VLQRKSRQLRRRIQDLERQLSRSAERVRQLEDAGQPEALHESEERLALAMNAAQFGAFDFYPQSGKLILSTVARRHFGLSPAAEASYEVLLRRTHPDDRSRVDRLLQEAMRPESGGRYAAEYRTIGVQGRLERWLSARGQVFFDPEDNAVRIIGVTQDLTERKHLEDQFLQAQKLDGIGRLAAGLAHDVNNLITIIIGYTEMALSGISPETPLRDSMEEIGNAAMRVASLTRQLLTFSRQQSSQPKEINLNDLVGEFKKMLQRLIGEDVELVLALDPEAGALRADPGQIEQVILNLAINARDAMPQGGRLFIETSRFLADEEVAQAQLGMVAGEYVLLSVSDTGSGMMEDVKAHIFEPFFTTKGVGKGTGLGLSTVYGIVARSGGTISVCSEPGHGSTFKLRFPAVEAGRSGTPKPSAEVTPAGYETILLAEDEATVRKYVRQILERQGYTVLEASNGREALELAQQHRGPIHLLLTDIVMPEMGGVDLVSEFGAARCQVPALCMSGYTDRVWRQGEFGYLQKPFTPTGLLTQLRAILDAAEAGPRLFSRAAK
jgi:two-component system cell cycle sensor histidine kinase/response regulator CckA